MMHPEWQGDPVGMKGRFSDVYQHTRSDAVQDLSTIQRLLILVLFQHAGPTYQTNNGTRYVGCNPKNAELADTVGVSERTVSRQLAELERAGVLEVETDGKNRQIFVILSEPKVDKSGTEGRHHMSSFQDPKVDKSDRNLDKPGAEGRQIRPEGRQTAPRIKEEQTEQIKKQIGTDTREAGLDVWKYHDRLKKSWPRTKHNDRAIVYAFASAVTRLAADRDWTHDRAAEFILDRAAEHYARLSDASMKACKTLRYVKDLRNWLSEGKATADIDAMCDAITREPGKPESKTDVAAGIEAVRRARMGVAS